MLRFHTDALSWHRLAVLAMALTFIGDLQIPRGAAIGIPYILIVLLALWAKRERSVVETAVACTVLTVVGFVLSPPGVMVASGLINRSLTVLAIWAVAALVLRYRQQRVRLRSSETRAQAIVDACEDGIITFDNDGLVLSANAAAGRIFGRVPDEISGSRLDMLLPSSGSHDEGSPSSRQFLHDDGHPATNCYEAEGRRADGSVFPVEVAVNTVQIDGREVNTAVLREISRRRMVEREVVRLGEEGRWQIGHELHEGLGQALTGTGILASRLARQLRASGDPRADEALRVAEAVQDADRQAKNLAQALVPVELDDEGLQVALQRLAGQLERDHGIRCAVELSGEAAPKDRFAAAFLYQILQQTVQQAVREAHAKEITVSLSRDAGRVCGKVDHDGLQPGESRDDGRAIYPVVKQWARLIGAQLEVYSRPGGTVTTVILGPDAPLPAGPTLQPCKVAS